MEIRYVYLRMGKKGNPGGSGHMNKSNEFGMFSNPLRQMQKDLATGWRAGKVQGVWERSRRSQIWSHDFSPGWTQQSRVRMLTERMMLVKYLHSTLNLDEPLLHRTSSLRLRIPPCSHYYFPQLKYGKTGLQRLGEPAGRELSQNQGWNSRKPVTAS